MGFRQLRAGRWRKEGISLKRLMARLKSCPDTCLIVDAGWVSGAKGG
jgi:hypothetical protein